LIRRSLLAAFAALALATVCLPVSAAVSLLGQREVEEALTCQCGCGLTVASCNHLECGFAVPARKRIAEALAKGETGDQILDGFKKEYGEKVLSSPVPEGFNVMAWIGPYLGIFLAGSLMFVFFRRRAMQASIVPVSTPGDSQERTDARIAQLREDVEDLQR
jgi:cytochrome c-type biogenesis protein CcmH/NrfF